MRRRSVALIAVITLLGTAVLVVARTLPPGPLPADAPAPDFSAMRALRHVEAIATDPHPTGSDANARVRAYILAELARLGIAAEEQPDGDLVNVLGRIAGSRSGDAVLLTAHYDSTPQSPGATDDASGVAALLETGRALQAGGAARNTVILLFTDHEEGGVLGARAFIARHPWADDVRVVVGLDAGGITGPGVLSSLSPESGWLVRQWLAADPDVVGSSAITALASSSTDFGRAFRPAGFPGYAFDLYWDKRDGPEDNLANLDLASLQHQGGHALALATRLGMLDLREIPREPDLIFFNVLRLFSVSYPSAWAFPIGAAVGALIVGLVGIGLGRRRLSGRGLAYGGAVALLGAGVAPLPVLLLGIVVGPFEPRVTADWDYRILDQPPAMAAIVAVCFALVVAWQRLARRLRRTTLADRTAGATLPLTAGLIGASLAAPALSFGFAWPLLASALFVLAWSVRAPLEPVTPPRLAGLLLAGGTAIVVVGSTIVLGVFDQLPLALASLGALSALLIPHVELILGGQADE